MECSTKKAESIQKELNKRENKRRGDTSKCHDQFGGGQSTGKRGWRTGNRRDKMRSAVLHIFPVDGETERWGMKCTESLQKHQQHALQKPRRMSRMRREKEKRPELLFSTSVTSLHAKATARRMGKIRMLKISQILLNVNGEEHTAAWEWKIRPQKEVMNKKTDELK